MSPFTQVFRCVEAKSQIDRVCENHDPLLGGFVPDDFGVSELGGVGGNDWVLCVGFERVSAISAVSNGLLLQTLHASWVFGKSVDRYDTIVLVWEETGGVVRIDDSRSGEDVCVVVWCPQGDLLVLPVVEIVRGLQMDQYVLQI